MQFAPAPCLYNVSSLPKCFPPSHHKQYPIYREKNECNPSPPEPIFFCPAILVPWICLEPLTSTKQLGNKTRQCRKGGVSFPGGEEAVKQKSTLWGCEAATLLHCYIATLLHCYIATLLHCYIVGLQCNILSRQ